MVSVKPAHRVAPGNHRCYNCREKRMIHFVAPPSDSGVTGGYIYNLNIARHLKNTVQCEFIDHRKLNGFHGALNGATGVLYDSLYITLTGPPDTPVPFLLMMHFIPSLQPALAEEERLSMEGREKGWLERASGFIVPSSYLRDELLRRSIEADRVRICRPGVDERFFRNRKERVSGNTHSAHGKNPSGALKLLTVANITPVKGYIELLQVLNDLADFEWCWSIAGRRDLDPEYARVFFERAETCRVAGRIHYLGTTTTERTAELMREADLFLLASQFEAYGMVLAEARSTGLPIVTNRVGGAREAAGRYAVFCTPGDTASWHAALKPLLTDTGKLHGLSTSMRTEASPRTWAEAASEFSDHLRFFSQPDARLKTTRW